MNVKSDLGISNGNMVKLPLYVLILAIIAVASWGVKNAAESSANQRDTVRILERMDTRNRAEFERVHSEHQTMCQEIRCLKKLP